MKILFKKIEIHYTYLIMALGLVLTGHFSNLIIFTSLILVHELGHILMILIFKYKIDKIIIYPYGGLTKINKRINTKIENDLLVAIMGLIFQTLYYYIIFFLYQKSIVRDYIFNLFKVYHTSMLIFNMLPIIPLDGSKIINLILSKYLPYNLSNNLTVVISLITIIIFLSSNSFQNNYSFVLVLGVLFQNIYKFYKNIGHLFNRFILERYLYNIKYNRVKIIKKKENMYKNKRHFFIKSNKIIGEREILDNFYKNNANKFD